MILKIIIKTNTGSEYMKGTDKLGYSTSIVKLFPLFPVKNMFRVLSRTIKNVRYRTTTDSDMSLTNRCILNSGTHLNKIN